MTLDEPSQGEVLRLSSLVRNVPGVTSIEVSPFWAVGDDPGFLFCKWFLPCCRRLSGRWESGNPAFGFPVFHGPTVSNSCFLFPILESVVGAVGMWKSRLLCEIAMESWKEAESCSWIPPLSTLRHFHSSLFIR